MGPPLRKFFVDEYHQVSLPVEQMENSSFTGIPTIIKGDRFQFDIKWLGRYGFYVIDLFDDTGERVRRIFPKLDVPYRIEALFDDPEHPDAEIFVGDETGQGNPIVPRTLATGEHSLNVASGRLKT